LRARRRRRHDARVRLGRGRSRGDGGAAGFAVRRPGDEEKNAKKRNPIHESTS